MYTRERWEVEFFTGRVKCEGMRSKKLGMCDEYFEGISSVWLVSENIVKDPDQ